MENATKALYIASGVLLGILILTLGVTLFANLQEYVKSSKDEIKFNDLNSFNTKFTSFVNLVDKNTTDFDLTIQDVVSAANLAYESNMNLNYDAYKNGKPEISDDNLYVAVYLEDERIDGNENNQLLMNNIEKKYLCRATWIEYNKNSGRVCRVTFKEKRT